MKTQRLTCPDCGAHLKVSQGRIFVFCEYCGTQIYIDDEVRRSEVTINKNINIKKTINNKNIIEDKTKIAEERTTTVVMICVAIMMVISLLFLYLSDSSIRDSFVSRFNSITQESEIIYIVMPSSSTAYTGENYEMVVEELTDAGFTNIHVVKDSPGIIGAFLYNDDEVLSVKINDNDVQAGKEYPSDAKIIVTCCYYSS